MTDPKQVTIASPLTGVDTLGLVEDLKRLKGEVEKHAKLHDEAATRFIEAEAKIKAIEDAQGSMRVDLVRLRESNHNLISATTVNTLQGKMTHKMLRVMYRDLLGHEFPEADLDEEEVVEPKKV